MKPAPLLPSLKEKKRYVVFEIFSSHSFTFEELKEGLLKEISRFFGTLEHAKAGITFLPDWNEHKGIIRINNHYLDHLRASFALIRNLNKRELVVTSIGVSGTLNKARTKFTAH